MKIRFEDRTNKDIAKLVEIAWANVDSHEDEIFRLREREEDAIFNFINDSTDDESSQENSSSNPEEMSLSENTDEFNEFRTPSTVRKYPVISVDTGIVNLGDFIGGGVAFAIRGTAVLTCEDKTVFLKYSTGAILVDRSNQLELFRYIGKRLGREDIYLKKKTTGEYVIDENVLGNTNQIQDRFRNFVERIIQEEAIGILNKNGGGMLLIDGALPAGTFDTPVKYVDDMLRFTASNSIDIVALSKKTRIVVNGKPLSSFFDDNPTFLGYASLKEIIREEREAVSSGARDVEQVTAANAIFAVRFGLGPPSLTFRADVHNSLGYMPSEVLDLVVQHCQIFGCYPRTLIDAHQQSSFMFQDVQLMTADLVARTGAQPKGDQSMEWMFQPFGAFGK